MPGMSRTLHFLQSQPSRQSYAPMAGKPSPSNHELPHQWNQATVTLIYRWKIKRRKRWGKRQNPKAKHSKRVQWKHCTKHMELMQAGLITLAPPHWPTDRQQKTVLLVLNGIKFHLTSLILHQKHLYKWSIKIFTPLFEKIHVIAVRMQLLKTSNFIGSP